MKEHCRLDESLNLLGTNHGNHLSKAENMDTAQIPSVLGTIILIAVFVVAFLIGDIAGLIIERKLSSRWRRVADLMSMEFLRRKSRSALISSMLLPRVIAYDVEESIFGYGESLRSMSGFVEGFPFSIYDFAIWNLHVRGPLVFRKVIAASQIRSSINGSVSLVKSSSDLAPGFSRNSSLKPYEFPSDKDFSATYAVFAEDVFPAWIVTDGLRKWCVDHQARVDCIMIRDTHVVVIFVDSTPERFPAATSSIVEFLTILQATIPSEN